MSGRCRYNPPGLSPLALTSGTRLGPYEIQSALGAGGMGEVYRARDTHLKRDVAIKVLPEALAQDTDRLARFQREAEVLATLNHPNIAAVYGLEKSGGTTAIVLELVEGETLAQRIDGLRAKGAGLPIDEALAIATQIADAIGAAHERGVVHRDLKPANVALTADDRVKVLDFGLAKDLGTGVGSARTPTPVPSMSPTLTTPALMTGVGVILGTAAYMSPEQAKGRAADKRSDVWAFGCVLFEMLTGKRAFEGADVSDTLAAILRGEPDWRALPVDLPAAIQKLLRRCLTKERKDRLADLADARLEIVDALTGPASGAPPASQSAWRTLAFAAVASATVAGILVGAGVWSITRNSRDSSTGQVVRFAIHDTDKVIVSRAEGDMALSPDGRTLAFVGYGEGGARIWIRTLDALEGRSLPGTEGASGLSWSPDGRSLAFAADFLIKRIALAGGTPEVVCTSRNNQGTRLAWGPDGTILYSDSRGFWRMPASGGTSVRLRAYEGIYDSPHFLPDGRHFLVAVRSADATKAGTFVSTLDESSRIRLLAFPTPARYAMGRLLFVRDRMLYTQAFDLSRLQLSGDATPVASGVVPTFTVSNNGVVAYVPLGASDQPEPSQLVWMNRRGQVQERIDQAVGALRPALSPDGRRLAVQLRGDIWVLELARGVLSRLTSGGTNAGSWTPDSQSLVYFRAAFRTSKDVIFETSVGRVGSETTVREPAGQHAHVTDVSPDGQYVIYEGEDEGFDVWVVKLTGDRKASAYVQSPGVETQGVVSPDGRWLAYTSDASGRFEIYVQSFPEPRSRVQVSPNGGRSAQWRRDGKELFYMSPDGTLTAVAVRSAQLPEFGPPTPLFQFFSTTERGVPTQRPPYDITADGQRFIVSAVVRRTDPSINVLLNWPSLVMGSKP